MTKEVLNTVPEWQMDDAYGSLTDPRWMASGDRLVSLTNQNAELTILVKRCATRSPSTKTHSRFNRQWLALPSVLVPKTRRTHLLPLKQTVLLANVTT